MPVSPRSSPDSTRSRPVDPRSRPVDPRRRPDGPPLRFKALRPPLVAVPAAVVAVLAFAWATEPGSLDDVFIVLCDARAWLGSAVEGSAEGAELATGRPAVEGSTSPLDVAVKALILAWAPSADPLRASGWVELVLLFAVAWFAARCVLRAWWASGVEGAPWRPWVAGGVVACGMVLAPGLVESAAFRLEGPLFGLLWLGACTSAAERRGRSTVLWALALGLARPEGLVVAPVLCWLGGGPDRRRSLRFALGGVGIVAGLTLVRLAVFGEIVPNTFFAKASDSRWQEILDGAAYLARAGATWPGVGVVGLALGTAFIASRVGPPAAGATARLLGLAALYAGVVILSGGDSYLGARLAMPVGLAVWLAVGRVWSAAPRLTLRLASIGLVLQIVGALPQPWPGVGPAFRFARTAALQGPVGLESFAGDARAFAACAEALHGEVFAHRHVQRFRWYEPSAPVLDMTGLTDHDVAHLPAQGPVRFGRDAIGLALERRVGALHLDPLRARPAALAAADTVRALADPEIAARFHGPPYLDLALARRVAEGYFPASLPLPEAGGFFNLFVRKDLAPRFRAAGFAVGER